MINYKRIMALACILVSITVSAVGCANKTPDSSEGNASSDSSKDASSTSTEDNSGGATASSGNYTFEFEDVDFTGKIGSGLSGSCEGTEMISTFFPDFYKIPEENQASNNHFVTFTYAGETYFDFNFTSDAESTATLVLRASTEIGTMSYNPKSLEVSVNGTILEFTPFTIEQGLTDGSQVPFYFYDFTLSSDVSLVAGENNIHIEVLDNQMRNGATAAPCFDSIELSTDAKLEFTPVTGNY